MLQLLASGRLPQPHLSFRSRVSELVELKRVSSPRSSRAFLSTILDAQAAHQRMRSQPILIIQDV